MKILKNIAVYIIPGLAGLSMLLFNWWFPSEAKVICKELGAPAVVLAGYSAAAFNLRFRMIDSIQKFEFKRSQVAHLQSVFERCRKNVDTCLIMFVVTTVILVVGKFSEQLPEWARGMILGFGSGLFLYCSIRFVQILTALKMVETFCFEQMQRLAKTH